MKNINKWLAPQLPEKEKLAFWLARRLLNIFIIFSILLLAFGWLFKDRLIFHPVKEGIANPGNYRLPYEERWLTTIGGDSIRAWRIPRPETGTSRVTVLFFQGNSGNMSLMLDRMAAFHSLGFDCYSVDYPGYGPSPGRPSEDSVYQSAEALWQWAAENGTKAEDTIVYGFSLGGGVASYLTAKKKPAALVLDSTFTRLRDVPGSDLPFLRPYLNLILGEAFDTQGRLSQSIGCPLVVLHSQNDDVVPYSLGLANYQGYGHRKKMVTGTGDHMGFLLNKNIYLKPLLDLAAEIDAGSPREESSALND